MTEIELANGEGVELDGNHYDDAAERLKTVDEGDRFVAGNGACGSKKWKVIEVTENDRGVVWIKAKAVVGYSPGTTKFVVHRKGTVGKKGSPGESYYVVLDEDEDENTDAAGAASDEPRAVTDGGSDESTFDEAEAGDRIVVEYESNRGAKGQTVAGEVVFVETNRGNDVTTAVWFLGEHNDRLYRVTGSTRPVLCRSPDEYTEDEAVEALSDFTGKAKTVRSLTRLDAASVVGAVEVVAVESPDDEKPDFESMDDYDLCAEAVAEAREGSLSSAFNALLNRQERIHTKFIRVSAYTPRTDQTERDATALRKRSDVLRDTLNECMDIIEDESRQH